MDRGRAPRTVIESHLELRRQGELEADLDRNYSPDVVFLTGTGIFRGHDGVRESAAELEYYLKPGSFEYRNVLVDGRMGFLEWHGEGGDGEVRDGADSYLVEDGLIVYQTIHYTVERP